MYLWNDFIVWTTSCGGKSIKTRKVSCFLSNSAPFSLLWHFVRLNPSLSPDSLSAAKVSQFVVWKWKFVSQYFKFPKSKLSLLIINLISVINIITSRSHWWTRYGEWQYLFKTNLIYRVVMAWKCADLYRLGRGNLR